MASMIGDLFDTVDDHAYALLPSGHASYGQHGNAAAPPAPRSEAFAGLVNQGNTCYLNAVLQTMFLTPELRAALYGLGDGARAVPLELQRLFAELEGLDRDDVSTEGLTRSFGWTRGQASEQHDAQELTRILFDAIEQCLLGTPSEPLIRNIYGGTLVNFIRCLNDPCTYRSERLEDFLDVQIPVRGHAGLEASLADFVDPETLSGDNQYSCERCETKVDASKGVLFRRLPHVLVFSLNRFEYDWEEDRRIKITDEFAFPTKLNMAPFCDEAGRADEAGLEYDLLSVVVHHGSAYAGHYRAYIRDLLAEDPQWYDFDDTRVSLAKEQDLEAYFGKGSGNSGTAYMLVYRRRGLDSGAAGLPPSIPDGLREWLDNRNAALRDDRAAHEQALHEIAVIVKTPALFSVTDEGYLRAKGAQRAHSDVASEASSSDALMEDLLPVDVDADADALSVPSLPSTPSETGMDLGQVSDDEGNIGSVALDSPRKFAPQQPLQQPSEQLAGTRTIRIDRRRPVVELWQRLAELAADDDVVRAALESGTVLQEVEQQGHRVRLRRVLSRRGESAESDTGTPDTGADAPEPGSLRAAGVVSGTAVLLWDGCTVDGVECQQIAEPIKVTVVELGLDEAFGDAVQDMGTWTVSISDSLPLSALRDAIADKTGLDRDGALHVLQPYYARPLREEGGDALLCEIGVTEGVQIAWEATVTDDDTSLAGKAVQQRRNQVQLFVSDTLSHPLGAAATLVLQIDRFSTIMDIKEALEKRVSDTETPVEMYQLRRTLPGGAQGDVLADNDGTLGGYGIHNGDSLLLELAATASSGRMVAAFSLRFVFGPSKTVYHCTASRAWTVAECIRELRKELVGEDAVTAGDGPLRLRETDLWDHAAKILAAGEEESVTLSEVDVRETDMLWLEPGTSVKDQVTVQLQWFASPDVDPIPVSTPSAYVFPPRSATFIRSLGEIDMPMTSPLAELKAAALDRVKEALVAEFSEIAGYSADFCTAAHLRAWDQGRLLRKDAISLKKHHIRDGSLIALQVLARPDERELGPHDMVLYVHERDNEQDLFRVPRELVFCTESELPAPERLLRALCQMYNIDAERKDTCLVAKHLQHGHKWSLLPLADKADGDAGLATKMAKGNIRASPFYLRDGDTIVVVPGDDVGDVGDFVERLRAGAMVGKSGGGGSGSGGSAGGGGGGRKKRAVARAPEAVLKIDWSAVDAD